MDQFPSSEGRIQWLLFWGLVVSHPITEQIHPDHYWALRWSPFGAVPPDPSPCLSLSLEYTAIGTAIYKWSSDAVVPPTSTPCDEMDCHSTRVYNMEEATLEVVMAENEAVFNFQFVTRDGLSKQQNNLPEQKCNLEDPTS